MVVGIHVNHLIITHDPRLRKHCISSDPLTLPQERLTGVKLGLEIHREYGFNSLHCVIPRSSVDGFTHYTGKIFGSHAETVLYRTAL